MKKAMLAQPMAGKTEEEIVATREKAIKTLEAKGYSIINTLFTDEWYNKEQMTARGVVQIPLCFLANLSKSDQDRVDMLDEKIFNLQGKCRNRRDTIQLSKLYRKRNEIITGRYTNEHYK